MSNTYTDRLKQRMPALGDTGWDDEMNDNAQILEALLTAIARDNYVLTGCAPTDGGGLQVDWAAGEVVVAGGIKTAIAASNDNCTASVKNWLYVNSSGTMVLSTTIPTNDFVPIAMIDAGVAAIDRIADLRYIMPNKGEQNAVINGNFKVWQRGTTFTGATTPANNDDTYLADRWINLSDGNDIVDISKETSVVPTGAYAAMKLDVETGNKKFGILQIIEAMNCKHLIGEVCSLSFKARVSTGASIDHLRAGVLAWDGAEDTVTSDVVSAWNAAGANQTLVANWTFENTPASLATLTDSYQIFKIENISVDTAGAKNLAIFIWIDDTTTTVGHFLYIADARLEKGPIATDFKDRLIQQELPLCQRYRLKSYDLDVVPGTATSDGAVEIYTNNLNNSDYSLGLNTRFCIVMRAPPTITLYDAAGNAGKITMSAGNNIVGAPLRQSEMGFYASGANGAASTGRQLLYQYVAESEL